MHTLIPLHKGMRDVMILRSFSNTWNSMLGFIYHLEFGIGEAPGKSPSTMKIDSDLTIKRLHDTFR